MEETSVYVCIFSKCCVCAKSLHSCLTLCDLMDCSPPGSSVHGILQARAPEWAAMPSSRGSSWPRKWTQISCNSCIAGRFFATQPPRKPIFPKDMEVMMGWELGPFLQFITEICQPSNHFATYCCLLISHPLSDSALRVISLSSPDNNHGFQMSSLE